MSRTDQPPATSPSARALVGIIEACYPTDIIHTAVDYYSDGSPPEMSITVEGVGSVTVPASPVPDPYTNQLWVAMVITAIGERRFVSPNNTKHIRT